MSRRVTRCAIIASIMLKDARAFSRNTFWAGVTAAGLVVYVATFWLLPDSVEETIAIGISPSGLAGALAQFSEKEEGASLVLFDTAQELEEVVAGDKEVWQTDEGITLVEVGEDGPEGGKRVDVDVGIAFPDQFVFSAGTGQENAVEIFVSGDVPEEIRGAVSSFVRELALGIQAAANGIPMEELLPVIWPDKETSVLGVDRLGKQIPLREKMRPLFAYFILMVESFALAGLVASEVQARTVTAILVTPARVSDFLLAKGLFGTILTFSQAALVLALIGAFQEGAPALLLVLLLGSMMMAGIGLLTGAAGKDFTGTMFYGILFLIPLLVPPIAALFPGSVSAWVKVLPSHGVVDALLGISAYGEEFAEILPDLGMAAAWLVVILGAGTLVLRRKVVSL